MAKVVREFIVRVNADGQLEAIQGFEKLDKAARQTAKGVGEADRAQKGVAQATSNSTKEFAKQAQGLGGIVRIYATVAANVFALSSAFNVLKRNADIDILRTSSQQLSVATGQNYGLIAQKLQEITGGTLAFRDAMQSANLALSGGLSGQQSQQIAEIATKAANALGRSVPEAVNRLTAAIVKAEPELADEFGIILRVTEATEDYARALGKLPSKLTTAEKQQAIFNQFLTQGTEKFADVEIQTNPYDKLAASLTDLTSKIISFVNVPIEGFISAFGDSTTALAGIIAALAGGIASLLLPELRNLSVKFLEAARNSKELAAADQAKALEARTKALKSLNDEMYDYVEVLRSGIKSSDAFVKSFKTVDLGPGIDAENFADTLMDEGNVGLGIRDKLLKNVFSGDKAAMTKAARGFAQGLDLAIQEATEKGLKTVNFRGYQASIAEATNTVELLGVAWKSTSQLEQEATGNATRNLRNIRNEMSAVSASAKLMGANIKLALVTGYASGLESGLLGSLKGIKQNFIEISQTVGGGLSGTISGVFGTGAKLAGGFLATATKVASALGTWGFALATVTALFSPLLDYLNITDKNSGKIKENFKTQAEAAELTQKTIKRLNTTSIKTFEDQISYATTSINLLNSMSTSLENIKNNFDLIDQSQSTFWGRFFNKAPQAIAQVSEMYNEMLKLSSPEERASLQQQFGSTEIESNFRLGSTSTAVGAVVLNNQELLDTLNAQLKEVSGKAEIREGKLFIRIPTNLSLEKAKELEDSLTIGTSRLLKTNQIGQGLTTTLNKLRTTQTDNKQSAVSYSKSLDDLSRALSENVTQLANNNRIYQALTAARNNFNEALKRGQEENISKEFKALGLDLSFVLKEFGKVGTTIENATPKDLDEAIGKYIEKLNLFQTATSNSAAEQARLNAELENIKDRVSRGDISAISDEYKNQSAQIEQQINLLKIQNQERELTRGQLSNSVEDAQLLTILEAQILETNNKIAELKAKQSTQYSDIVASEKISLELAKANEQVSKSRADVVNQTASVYSKIADITGNTSDIEARFNFEEKVTAAKLEQLRATIATKQAELSGAEGARIDVLKAELAALRSQLDVTRQLSALEQIEKAADNRTKQLELENKYLETQLKLEQGNIDLAKQRVELIASSRFNTTADRDAAEELAVKLELASAEQARKESLFEVQKIEKEILSELQKIDELNNSGITSAEKTRRLEELKLDLVLAEQEARAATLEQELAIEKSRENQYQLAKKNADLFKRPEEFKAILGEEFRRAAEDFAEKMGSGINRVVNITTGTIDAGIDAFVDAIRSGENALQAAKDAIVNTFLDLNNEFIKDQFKLLLRQGLGNLFGDAGKNFGKSPELIIAEQDLVIQQGILTAVQTMAAKSAMAGAGGKDIFSSEFISKLSSGLIKDPISSGAEKELIASLTKGSDQQKQIAEQTADMFKESNSNLLSGLTDIFSGFFSNFNTGGLGQMAGNAISGIGGLIMQGINLFFAKGGLTGEITKRIPMYANGTVTSGPELAMIGEGTKREAVVPLPDNRSIPVTMTGEPESAKTVNNSFNINITGVQGNEQGIRRSANQLALELARAQETAKRRIG